MNSKRLPSKVMLRILGKPVIWHIYNRLMSCKLLNSVVISTGNYQENIEICDFAEKNNILFFSGSEIDLIDRLYKTALKFKATAIVRVTSDCPLIDPEIVDMLVSKYLDGKYDIVTNCYKHTFPHGLDAEVYSVNVLEKLSNEIKNLNLREWFVLYIKQNSAMFKILNVVHDGDLSKYRLTLDYPEDFELITTIYQQLYAKKGIFYMKDILNLLEKNPQLMEINSKYVGKYNIDAPSS